MIELKWNQFKMLIDGGHNRILLFESINEYKLVSLDDDISVICVINRKNGISERKDFEDNYKNNILSKKALTTRAHRVNSNLTYYGEATDGSLTSDAKWRIYRVYKQNNQDIKEYAGENKKYDKIWDNRNTYFNAGVYNNQKSLLFDGLNDYINFGNIFNYESNQAFSFSFWMNSNNFSSTRYIVNKLSTQAGNPGWRLGHNSSGQLMTQMRAVGQGFSTYAFDTVLTPMQWYFITWTFSGNGNTNGQKLYVNSVLDTFTAPPNTLTYTMYDGQNFEIGRSQGTYYSGYLDEFYFYNKALNQSEITELYNSGSPIDMNIFSGLSNVVSGYNFEEDVYPTTLDQMNSNNGTLVNVSESSYSLVVP